MFFRKNYAAPGPGIDPDEPEKTGMARFAEILSLECTTLLKLNLLLLLCAVPVVTLPPALYAMHCVVRKMILDQPVDCFYDFKTAFRRHWKRGYAAFFLVAAPLGLSGCGVWFYLGRALEYPLFFLPFMLCSTVFLTVYGTLTIAILEFPLSAVYLLFIGFSGPCLLGNFFIRTILTQFE